MNSKKTSALQSIIMEEAETLVGCEMIYQLATIASDWLEDQATDEDDTGGYQREEIDITFDGTPVTKEAFDIWFAKYLKDQEDNAPKKKKRKNMKKKDKISGREFFQNVGRELEAKAKESGVDTEVDWALFDDDLDIDIDDIDIDEIDN